MSSQELAKSIEAKRLNKRSKLPLPEPPVIIPFGGLVSEIEDDGGLVRFSYLGELYQCSPDLLNSALRLGGQGGHVAAPRSGESASAAAPMAAPEPTLFHWQEIRTNHGELWRAQVPGGWLLMTAARALAFYPDAGHAWDGRTSE